MAFGTMDDSDDVMNEINMTPMVDIMLVLLIIFIITVPVMKHAVDIDLPRQSTQQEDQKPDRMRLSVDADGVFYWNELRVTDEELEAHMRSAAALNPQPDLAIRGDKSVRYERVMQAIGLATQTGLKRVGFVTEPKS